MKPTTETSARPHATATFADHAQVSLDPAADPVCASPATDLDPAEPSAAQRWIPSTFLDSANEPQEPESDPEDQAALHRCETDIDNHLVQAFLVVGRALREIRDRALYKQGPDGTFEEYLQRRWSLERTYAYRLIQAAQIYENLLTIGNIALPTCEAQLRPLVRLDADSQRQAWRQAVYATPGRSVPTAHQVAEAAAVLQPAGPEERRPRLRADRSPERLASAASEQMPDKTPLAKEDPLDAEPDLAAEQLSMCAPEDDPPTSATDADAEQTPLRLLHSSQRQGNEMTAATVAKVVVPDPAPATPLPPTEDADESPDDHIERPSLFPTAAVQKASDRISRHDFALSNDPDLPSCARWLIPEVVRLLDSCARRFPETEGRDLSRALGIANTKLQIVMGWM